MSEALRKRIAELEAELDLLKSPSIRTMNLCKCTKSYKLPSESVCKVCKIAELQADVAYLYCPKCKQSVPRSEVVDGWHSCGRYTVALFSEERRKRYRAEERITELQAELLTYQWVAVKDRLPNEPTDVEGELIAVTANLGHLGTMWLFPNSNWKESFDRMCYTHWRYVTLPPEKEGE